MENLTFKQKMMYVLKRYGYYLLLGLLLLTVVITLTVVGLSSKKEGPIEDNSVPTNTVVSPFMPVLNASVYKGYYGNELVFNETLNQWETHKAIDFQVASGSAVYAILDGTVKNVYTNLLEGTVVEIEHDNGITSTYGSLEESLSLKIGDRVSRGQEIGKVSESATSEASAGAHLHFSMKEGDNKIDPSAYLNISSK